MRRTHPRFWMVFAVALLATNALAAGDDWIAQSNRYADILLQANARYAPETFAALGVEGYDEQVFDLKPRFAQRLEADLEQAAQQLEAAREEVEDPRVRQDLEILIDAARDAKHTSELNRQYMLPFFDLPQALFRGFQNLLDPRVPKERYAAALIRLRKYVGAQSGFTPITVLARQRYEESARNPALLGPWVVEARQYLDNQQRYLDGIEQLLKKSELRGWQAHLRTLRKQVDDYGAWIRTTVLPRARATSQLPRPLYANNLKNFGVEMAPEEIMDRALASYVATRSEIQSVAQLVAAQRKWNEADYRAVIRELKKERIPEERLLDVYRARLARIEEMVRRERIVTLPAREAVIRLATAAESAATPAPHIDPPRLIGNTGEPAEFVLPVSNPNAQSDEQMDDFNYDAIAWTLTAHEARPGHELQFARMMERGVSTARVVFAFNSANIEGWALYAEALMKPFVPPEGQIGVLQMRMMREARAFLDPMLNLGLTTPEAAKRVLMEEVMLSEPMAQQEIDRYTFRAPGQATAYFYGYSKFNALRTKVELAMSGHFQQQAFHDYLIGQGLLPFDLLEKAALENFVPAQRPAATE